MRPDEILEVEADRRRRVDEAFRLGSEASTAGAGLSWIGPLAAGAAIAIAIALILGIIALAQAASTSGGATRSPSPVVTPSR